MRFAKEAFLFELLFNRCFFNEHHGNFVAYWVNESAFVIRAFQTTRVGLDFDFRFAFRTAQDF
jgi:hypothetical protein